MTSENTDCTLRIVLLGKTGAGKSATGNTILGREAFEVTHFVKSTNKVCEVQTTMVGGKTISVIDTPGLFNTSKTEKELKADIEKCIFTSLPGPHVFLLVIKLGVRFTKEERETMKWIHENFGEEVVHRTLIVFTHTDRLKDTPFEEYIGTSMSLPKIVDSCGGRYHSFNNEDRKNRDQVTELLNKINTMLEKHEHSHYTHEMFKQAQRRKKINEIKAKSEIVCAVTLLGAGILITAKIVLDKSSAGRLEAVTGAVLALAEEAIEKVAEGAAVAAGTAITATEEAIEKVAEGAAVAAGTAITATEEAIEKVAEGAAAAAEIAVTEGASSARRTLIGGGVATGVLTAAASAAAKAAAAAGRVATTGRVGAVAAMAALTTGAIFTIISALKQSMKG